METIAAFNTYVNIKVIDEAYKVFVSGSERSNEQTKEINRSIVR